MYKTSKEFTAQAESGIFLEMQGQGWGEEAVGKKLQQGKYNINATRCPSALSTSDIHGHNLSLRCP